MKRRLLTWLALAFLATGRPASSSTYEVGPGQKLSAIGQVPWESLQPGDMILIHWRAEPYHEKWVICRQGKPDAPITVRGVPGPDGLLPVIDGKDATTRAQLNYWGGVRNVIKVGGARNPPDTMPRYVVIENLDVRNGRPPFTFTEADGKVQSYSRYAAAIRVEKAEHLTIRNCVLHDSGNGLFISSNDQQASRDILIEGNYIYGNGNPGSGQEHNAYTEAIGITYQYNRFGRLRAGSLGNNLKDRSAGLVVRYNWIEGGNKELDLVDAEDSALIRREPRYRETFVYGNVFLKLMSDEHPFLVHYGGDSGKLANYRKGTLYFYNNTVVSYRTGATILFRLSSNAEHCDFRNNLVHVATPKGALGVVENKGSLDLSHNWFRSGWKTRMGKNAAAVTRDDGTSVVGSTPGFVELAARDFHLMPTSPCRDGAVGPDVEPFRSHPVDRQYVKHQSGEIRPGDGRLDIGAFEVNPPSAKP